MNQGTITGSPIGRRISLAALVAVLGALLFLLPGLLVQAQESITIEYTENSTDAVVTLSAGDPEDATPITWSLVTEIESPTAQMVGGVALVAADIADFGDFKISQSGVLEFISPPNIEGAVDSDTDNTYNVVVQATDGDAGPPTAAVNLSDRDTRRWFKVTVNVSDVEEAGSVRLRPTAQTSTTLLQPQVGVNITAAGLMDGDGVSSTNRGAPAITTATYQWYRTDSRSATGTAISSTTENSTGTGPTYTPVHLDGGSSDIGKYLRVVATYTDGRGSGKTATAVSLYQAIGRIGDNQPPSFTDGTTTTRGVREDAARGTNIGFPVSATDRESPASSFGEKLTYWLGTTGGDEAMFSIDAATGQLKTKDKLDRDVPNGDSHTVQVLVTDSSGDMTNNEDTITVTINVLAADEPPTVAGEATIEHPERTTALDTNLTADGITEGTDDAQYTATDPEGGAVTFSLGGADKDLFKLNELTTPSDTIKVLAFKEKPDFENPMDSNSDNVYEVTVQVSDDANMGSKAVTVKVTNVQEDGEVEVTPSQPRIGVEVTAALTDSDIVGYGPAWQWQRTLGEATDTTCADKDADANVWTNIPGASSATYEPRSSDLNYCLQAVATYNDRFHEGTAETTGIYLDVFTTDSTTNLRFDKTANMALSAVQYPSNNLPPAFGSATTKRFVPESIAVGNEIGEPVTANDPNGADDLVAGGYSLSGADQNTFNINSGTGQLMTAAVLDHEKKEKYSLTVTATDSFGASDTIRVDIYVVDVDEAPAGTGTTTAESTIEYTEKSKDAVLTLSAGDPEGATPITWSVPADDADPDGTDGDLTTADAQDNELFKINQDGVLEFLSSPNYESAADEGANNTYNVVVQATDGDAGPPIDADNLSQRDTRSWFKVIVNVSGVEEEGSITLRPTAQTSTTLLQPQVGVGITATAPTDGDGGVTGTTYQWYRTTSRTADGTAISGAMDAAYLPVHLQGGNSDRGRYLRVVATYDDANGDDKTATAVSLYPTIAAITDNKAPSFTDGTATIRGVRENTEIGVNIGFPVTATDPESGVGEKLTYWLDSTGDDASLFSLDAATGQLKTNAVLNHEDEDSRPEVTVLVTDSSGNATDNQDTITVTINVLDADESPTVSGEGTIEHSEGTTALDRDLSTETITETDDARYLAADEDGGTITFSLGGADKDLFKLDDPVPAVANTMILSFKAKPDFENPMDSNRDNVYEVTIQASDDANMGTKAVTVKVTNVQEDGEVEVNPSQPRIGIPVTSALTDSDIVAYGPMWQWQRSLGAEADTSCADKDADTNVWTNISGASLATYEPRSSDVSYCLRAVATYNDGFHQGTASTDAATLGLYPDIAAPNERPNRFDKTANMPMVAVQYPSNNIAPRFSSDATKNTYMVRA